MRDKGATAGKAVNLILIGPMLIAAGYTEDQVYRSLMNLSRSGIIVLDESKNSVRFSDAK